MSAENQTAIDNLKGSQTQLDMDGVMVGVSRQALEEVLATHDALLEVAARFAMAMWQSGITPEKDSDSPFAALAFDAHAALTKATGRDVVGDNLEAICAGNRAAISSRRSEVG